VRTEKKELKEFSAKALSLFDHFIDWKHKLIYNCFCNLDIKKANKKKRYDIITGNDFYYLNSCIEKAKYARWRGHRNKIASISNLLEIKAKTNKEEELKG
jgi:hypothetical protein